MTKLNLRHDLRAQFRWLQYREIAEGKNFYLQRRDLNPSEKAVRVPRLPQNGTVIDFHEFTGFVEIKRVSNHLANYRIRYRG